MNDFMRFVKINKICVIIALLLGTVSYAQANIDVIQYSAEFVKDNEISLNNFKQYNTKVLYMSKDSDSFVENKVEYIPTIILFHNGEEAGISLTLPDNTIQLIDNQIDSILESKF
jgi:hypothetical protein